jgi:soluble lytic murein transglycosylase-like protein
MNRELHRRQKKREGKFWAREMFLAPRFIALGLIATLACLASLCRAAELVNLTDGYVQRCDHHALVDGRIRVYLSAGEDNYIDYKPVQVASIDAIPDPPPAVSSAPASGTQAHTAVTPGDLREMLTKAGADHNLDVDLLASVVKAESDGNARAMSSAGARGLMQLMPGTAAGLGVKDSFQPDENVRGGSTYLDALLTKYHDNLGLALAAYNAGPEAVDKYHGIPPYHETQAYVAYVIHEFNRRVLAREAEARHAASANATPGQPAQIR